MPLSAQPSAFHFFANRRNRRLSMKIIIGLLLHWIVQMSISSIAKLQILPRIYHLQPLACFGVDSRYGDIGGKLDVHGDSGGFHNFGGRSILLSVFLGWLLTFLFAWFRDVSCELESASFGDFVKLFNSERASLQCAPGANNTSMDLPCR